MRPLLWVVPVAFFFLNPSFACGTDEPPYQYGAAEMRAAVEGDWCFTITPDGGAAMQVTVHLQQAATAPAAPHASGRALVRAAYACGSRTLLKSAGACTDSSQMPLVVHYLSGDPSFSSAAMSGTFTVTGLTFSSGNLELGVGAYQVLIQVNADGSLVDPHIGPLGSAGTLTVSRP